MSDQFWVGFWNGVSVGGLTVLCCVVLLGILHRGRGNSGIYQTRRDPKQSSATFKPPQGGSGTVKPMFYDDSAMVQLLAAQQSKPFVCTYCMREFPDKNWTKPCPHFGEV